MKKMQKFNYIINFLGAYYLYWYCHFHANLTKPKHHQRTRAKMRTCFGSVFSLRHHCLPGWATKCPSRVISAWQLGSHGLSFPQPLRQVSSYAVNVVLGHHHPAMPSCCAVRVRRSHCDRRRPSSEAKKFLAGLDFAKGISANTRVWEGGKVKI